MENKINLVEILKDCPPDMKLDCTMCNDVVFEKINFCSSSDKYPIVIRKTNTNTFIFLTEYGQFVAEKDYKCVIFPEGKTTWEGFIPPCKFKDGDIIYTLLEGNFEFISIFKKASKTRIYSYADLGSQLYSRNPEGLCVIDDIKSLRLATGEEKQKLFDAIKDNGYKWNEETKTLEKLMIEPKFKVGDKIVEKNGVYAPILIANVDKEFYYFNTESSVGILPILDQDKYELVPDKFDISTLKPYDKVLVRTKTFTPAWTIDFYDGYRPNMGGSFTPFGVSGGKYFQQCIPYEGNEHLIGKTYDCDEFYKTWK